ncbi:hypothetical protein [Rhizobium halophytocola]|uniref:Flagellar basal body P-ring protein FlgI n=1 Tax=Rhizobium halophytocola TaxID=735519 RepID=A0ABS4E452_9HYPH|nr:hypothetical protein [Rhizobium halophytocola]MBP1852692.1 flagellar basal body P-ring protein FlgI [Rhizobium halophytocola]
MTALTKDRNTPRRSGDNRQFPVAAGAKLFAGAMGAVNAAGLAVRMTTATTIKGAGRIKRPVDNTAGAAGDLVVDIEVGIFRYENSAGADLITKAAIGAVCYGVDDQTVALTSGTNTRSVAGTIFDVDDQGVWVEFA